MRWWRVHRHEVTFRISQSFVFLYQSVPICCAVSQRLGCHLHLSTYALIVLSGKCHNRFGGTRWRSPMRWSSWQESCHWHCAPHVGGRRPTLGSFIDHYQSFASCQRDRFCPTPCSELTVDAGEVVTNRRLGNMENLCHFCVGGPGGEQL